MHNLDGIISLFKALHNFSGQKVFFPFTVTKTISAKNHFGSLQLQPLFSWFKRVQCSYCKFHGRFSQCSKKEKPFVHYLKGQLVSKANCQAKDSSKKRTNEFVFTTVRRVFVFFWRILGLIALLSKLTDL